MTVLPPDAFEAGGEPVQAEVLPLVPDLMGLSLGEACAAAAWASISVNATSVGRLRAPWGIVVAQSPSPGTRLKGRWRIHVLVSAPATAAGSDGD